MEEDRLMVQRSKRSLHPSKIEEMQREVKAFHWKVRGGLLRSRLRAPSISASIPSTTLWT